MLGRNELRIRNTNNWIRSLAVNGEGFIENKMGKCYACGGKGSLKHLDRDICRKCFLKNIEKRVKKHLGRKLFKKNSNILVIGDLENVLLKKVIKDLPVKITFKKKLPKEIKGFDWVIIGKTLDDVGEKFLTGLFKGKLLVGKTKKKIFNLLEPLTLDEVTLYAKLNKIKFKIKKQVGLLEKLKEYKELKYNLHKNIKELKKVFK